MVIDRPGRRRGEGAAQREHVPACLPAMDFFAAAAAEAKPRGAVLFAPR